jgi:hypothetical protein
MTMKSIHSAIETVWSSAPPWLRICLTLTMAAATMLLATHAGRSIGKALYYLGH